MLKQFFLQGMAFVSGCDITDPILQPLADGEQSFKMLCFCNQLFKFNTFLPKSYPSYRCLELVTMS